LSIFVVIISLDIIGGQHYIHIYSPIYMVAEIRKTATTTTERKKERKKPMTNIP